MNGKPVAHILIVDDSRPLREEIKRALSFPDMQIEFHEAENGLDGFKMLMDEPIDLVLCDLVMPHMDGFKFLKMRSSRPDLEAVPVLMLTAVGETDQKIKLLSAGAGDYIVKPFHPGELLARANVHLRRKLLQDELKQKNALLTELSTQDGLTKINNRRHFLELAHAEVSRSRRLEQPVSILLMDVDHFKQINDTYGHHTGDMVLTSICGAIRHELRAYDIFGRYGGDELIVLFPQTDGDEALEVAERTETTIQALAIPGLSGLSLSFSGGVASRTPEADDLESMIKMADQALYKAKTGGRGSVVKA